MSSKKVPYIDGLLIPSWPRYEPISECNSSCSCDNTCNNRLVQFGSTVKVEAFKTKNKGWGIKACEFIPRGKFIADYVGEMIDEEEAERRGNTYDKGQLSFLFDLDWNEKKRKLFYYRCNTSGQFFKINESFL